MYGEQWREIKVDKANTAWLSDITLFISPSVAQTVNLKNSILLEHGSVIDLDIHIFSNQNLLSKNIFYSFKSYRILLLCQNKLCGIIRSSKQGDKNSHTTAFNRVAIQHYKINPEV